MPTKSIPKCAVCGEECSTRKNGTPRLPLQHKWGPVSHGDFVSDRGNIRDIPMFADFYLPHEK